MKTSPPLQWRKESNTEMLKKLLLTVALASLAAPASAGVGTTLQLQFQRWAYHSQSGTVELLVTLRNTTLKPFAVVRWNCEFYDHEQRLVGRSPLTFYTVPWGSIIVATQLVSSNHQFQSGKCQLVDTEDVTLENERLYRPLHGSAAYGNSHPYAREWFSFDHPIQGSAEVLSAAEHQELEQKLNSLRTKAPGYRPPYGSNIN